MQSFAPDVDASEARGKWAWFLAYGILLVAVGIIALGNVVSATLVTTIWLGFLLMFGGAVELVSAFTFPRSLGGRILHILLGLLYLGAGFLVAFNPISGAVTVTIVVAAMLIADGVLRLWFALTTDVASRWLLAVLGVVDLLLGLWLWTNIPVSALALGFYVGFMLLVAGISWIMLALRVR